MPDFSAATVNAGVRRHVLDLFDAAPGGSNKDRVSWVAAVLQITASRVAKYKYGTFSRIDAHEADQIRYFAREATRLHLERLAAEYEAKHASYVAEARAAGMDGGEPLGGVFPPEID